MPMDLEYVLAGFLHILAITLTISQALTEFCMFQGIVREKAEARRRTAVSKGARCGLSASERRCGK